MKLAKLLLNEVLNSSSIYIKQRVVKITDAEKVYSITSFRGHVTKVIIFYRAGEFRIVEVKSKTDLFSPAFNKEASEDGYTMFEGTVEGVLKALPTRFASAIRALGLTLGYSGQDFMNRMLQKYGDASIKKDHKWLSAEKAYMWLLKEGVLDTIIRTSIPEFSTVDHSQQETTIKHNNVTLIGFDETKHKDIIKIIDDTEKALKKHGFGDLVYGKFFMVPKASSTNRTLADYLNKDDTVRVFEKASKNSSYSPVIVMTHELGHRYYYKKLSESGRAEVSQEFYKRLSKWSSKVKDELADIVKQNELTVGQRVQHPVHGELEYGGVGAKSLYGRKLYYKLYFVKDGKKTTKFLGFDSIGEVMKYISSSNEPIDSGTKTGDDWLPTAYSRTDAVEWFAEIFAFAIANNNKEILDWIKGLK